MASQVRRATHGGGAIAVAHFFRTLLLVLGTLIAMSNTGNAQTREPAAIIERFEIVEDRLAFGGQIFGDAGAYRYILAKAHVSVRRLHATNRAIADLDNAPRTAEGDVTYVADVAILRPQAAALARRVMMAEVPNRGLQLGLSGVNDINLARFFMPPKPDAPPPGAPFWAPADSGNGFLFRRGYTLVWVGWQADLPPGPFLRAQFPVATQNGAPITGRVQSEMVFDNRDAQSIMPLAYPAAPGDQSGASLSVRARPSDAPRFLSHEAWRFVDARRVQIDRPADADAGAIYELVYTATDPIVAGLGFAATRDIIGFLRHAEHDEAGGANPLADLHFDYVIGLGNSQSGRYIRDMLYQGFNDDGAGRPVFDGAIINIAGSRRSFTNRRWAEPGRFSRQHEDWLVYGNQFPFTYQTTRDPVTGAEDGILARCTHQCVCPKIFHVDGASEFWNAGASLVFNDGRGRDLAIPDNVRAYMIASQPHAPAMSSAANALPSNPLTSQSVMRAMLLNMDAWLSSGVEPPPSRWPRLARGELAPPTSRKAVGFPSFSRLPYSGVVNQVVVTDYDQVPARVDEARAYQMLVPTTDADGNDRAGIRLPQIAAPTGTYLGWNPRRAGFGEGDISLVYGGYLPFAQTRAERQAEGDPRLSIEERYSSQDVRQRHFDDAKAALMNDRLYLDGDR